MLKQHISAYATLQSACLAVTLLLTANPAAVFAANGAKTQAAAQPMMFLLQPEGTLAKNSTVQPFTTSVAQKGVQPVLAAQHPVVPTKANAPVKVAANAAKPADTAKSAKDSPPTNSADGEKRTAGPARLDASTRRKNRNLAPMMTWVNPDVEPKAALLCVHGLGLHSGTYEDFGKRMAALGVATYSCDIRGFGSWQQSKSGGHSTEVDFEDCLADVVSALHFIHKANPGLPVFILGESMGGAIALRITSQNPDIVDGLISCVPSGDRFKQKATDLKVAFHFLTGGANKKFDVGSQVIEQAASCNEESVKNNPDKKCEINEQLKKDWSQDPLARMDLSAKELWQFQHFMNENHEAAKAIKSKPVLMVQGWEDNLVKWTGTLELWKELATDDKQIELIPNAKHLIFEEAQSNDQALNTRVQKMVIRWIDDHIPQPHTVRSASNGPTP